MVDGKLIRLEHNQVEIWEGNQPPQSCDLLVFKFSYHLDLKIAIGVCFPI